MVDIHCHLLPLVDDGSKSMEESIYLLKKMKNHGFTDVILTPHYIEDTEYNCDNDQKLKIFNQLKKELKNNQIDINIYLGNEIYVSNNLQKLLNSNQIMSLNNTKYLLLELPRGSKLYNLDVILEQVMSQGYIPIIAHPERILYFQKNYSLIDNLAKKGILFQVNYSSILGNYGRDSLKLVKYLLKKRYISFLATDLHQARLETTLTNLDLIKKKIIKYSSDNYYQEIISNGEIIIKCQDK